jgi:succinate-semialdehyde dehydrogenase / glutarate-semialdehyde dehydrogenase
MQTSINPATGAVIQQYPFHTQAEVQQIIAQGHACFMQWRSLPLAERRRHILNVAAVLTKNQADYGRIMSTEMGKPLKEAIAEIDKCASTAKYFAEHAEAFLNDQPVATEYRKSYVTFQPLGIVFGVMPWNFPFWQVLRFALPSLMAGNVCLLKHASNTPGCALAIESIFREAGLPPHAFQALLIPGSRTEEVIAHPKVSAVTLTGSTPAGRSVAAVAGKHLKKTVLELGGSDAYLVLADADLDHAIQTIGVSRLLNCGQSCVSAKRLIVHESLKERFEQSLLAIFTAAKQGDPLDPATTLGPMSRADLRDELHQQVERSIKAGARCLTGGTIPSGKGAFYPPTILTDVRKGIPAFEEEIFGPVAVIIPVGSEEEAIATANDSVFGLGGAVFTTDLSRGEKIARERIESGVCFVNMMVRSDPRLPFGGIKDSGYGRELAAFGLHEFVNIKTIVVA